MNKTTYKVPRVCAWCKIVVGYADFTYPAPHTHGICANCREIYFPRPLVARPSIRRRFGWLRRLAAVNGRILASMGRTAAICVLFSGLSGAGMVDDAQAKIEAGKYDSIMAVDRSESPSGGLSRGTVYPVVGGAFLADFVSQEVLEAQFDGGSHEYNTWAPWSLKTTEGRAAATVAGTVVASEGVMLINRSSTDAAKVALWAVVTVKLFVAGHNIQIAWN